MHLLKSLNLQINISLKLESILIEYLFGGLRLLVTTNNNHFLEIGRILIFNTTKFFLLPQVLL